MERDTELLLRDALTALAEEEWARRTDRRGDTDFSPGFEDKMRRALAAGSRRGERKPGRRAFSLIAALTALFLLVCGGALGAAAARVFAQRWGGTVLRNWDGHFRVSYEADPDAPDTIQTKREPKEVPQDWTRQVAGDGKTSYDLLYTDENGVLTLTYSQSVMSAGTTLFYTRDYRVIETVNVGGREGELMRHTDGVSLALTWSDGDYFYDLRSKTETVSSELLLAIGRSVDRSVGD